MSAITPIQGDLIAGFNLPEAKDLDEMYTPPDRFAEWHKEFGFTRDACATGESAKLPRFWHAGKDALQQDWTGERIWLNPPYSRLWDFTVKVDHAMRRGCQLVVGLYPATRSEQPFWQNFIEPYRDLPGDEERDQDGHLWVIAPELQRIFTVETRNIAGRIVFGKPGDPEAKRSKQSGKFPSVLIVWRAR